MYVIQAPEGSRVVAEVDPLGELVVPEVLPGGTVVERRLPFPIVLKAARRGHLGLVIRQERDPRPHPEVEPAFPRD
ncbi:MAG TPA: hypothetical protein VF590_06830 [Isosphaeraceae bacterium]